MAKGLQRIVTARRGVTPTLNCVTDALCALIDLTDWANKIPNIKRFFFFIASESFVSVLSVSVMRPSAVKLNWFFLQFTFFAHHYYLNVMFNICVKFPLDNFYQMLKRFLNSAKRLVKNKQIFCKFYSSYSILKASFILNKIKRISSSGKPWFE